MTYTMKAALEPCTEAPLYGRTELSDSTPGAEGSLELDHQLGCIVRRNYGAMSRANDTAA